MKRTVAFIAIVLLLLCTGMTGFADDSPDIPDDLTETAEMTQSDTDDQIITRAEMEQRVRAAIAAGLSVREGWDKSDGWIHHQPNHPLEYEIHYEEMFCDYDEHIIYCANTNCENSKISLGLESHNYDTFTYTNGTYHRITCSRCGLYIDDTIENKHSFTWIDYSASRHKKACRLCDYDSHIGILDPHAFTNWSTYNASLHERFCSVCHRRETGPHNMGDWLDFSSSTHKKRCSVCDYGITENHSYGNYMKYSATQHRKQCGVSTCAHYSTPVNHTFGSWVSTSSTQHRRTCSGCSYEAVADHTFGSWSSYSSTQHRRKCSGCSKYVYANHGFIYSGGELVCSTCGYSKPYGS